MADENVEVEAVGAPGRGKAGIIKLVIAGVVVVALVAAIAFGVAIFTAQSISKADPAKGNGYGIVKTDTLGTTYEAGEFITNLNSESGDRFIKVKIVFAFDNVELEPEITNKLPEIQHTINSTLRQQVPKALSEPKAMEKLAELLKTNVNSLLITGNLSSVYFTSFVVQ